MEPDENTVQHDSAQINGQTEAPRGSDNTEPDARAKDNLNTDLQENSANGLDSEDVRGGQDGRNIRGMGSQDMDSKNGLLRMGDQDSSTMEVTEAAVSTAAASESKTSTVSVTTAGPDDYASDAEVKVPNAQKEAKEAAREDDIEEGDVDSSDDELTSKEDKDIAETGTSLDNQPTY